MQRISPAAILLLQVFLSVLPVLAETSSESTDIEPTSNNLPDLLISELEFIDQPIAEIIISLAQIAEISLLPDQSIRGRRSYYFRNISLKQALHQILEDNNLHLISSGPIWLVTSIGLWLSEDGNVNSEIEDVLISDILNTLSKITFTPIRFSSLPPDKSSLYIRDASVEEIVNILLQPYPEYEVRENGNYISIVNTRNINQISSRALIHRAEGGLSIDGKNIVVSELLRELFSREDKEVLLFNHNNLVIQELRINNRSFDEVLDLITEITGLSYREHKGVFAFFQSSPQPSVLQYSASHHSPEQLADLIPAGLLADCNIQTPFANSQTMLLIGQDENCNQLLQILHQLDNPHPVSIRTFNVIYINSEELFTLLPSRFSNQIHVSRDQLGMYYGFMSPDDFQDLETLLKQIDIPQKTRIHRLQYLSTREVIDNLPPGFPAWRIQESSDPRTLYISGDSQFYEQFRSFIDPIDKPPVQTQYHILIIQYQQNSSSNYSGDLGISVLNDDSEDGITADLSQVLNLNFDIVSAFGYGFAADLSLDISSSRARILADNLLRGESGKPIHFENTSTYRYREVTDNNSPGVIRELTTGLMIDIIGRADNEDFVHMDVSVQLSKQGVDVSNRGSLPPSTARRLETSLNTPSGTPVRIAGIVLQEDSSYSSGIFPLANTGDSQEQSEFVIYILPFSIPVVGDREYLPDPETMFWELVHDQ